MKVRIEHTNLMVLALYYKDICYQMLILKAILNDGWINEINEAHDNKNKYQTYTIINDQIIYFYVHENKVFCHVLWFYKYESSH